MGTFVRKTKKLIMHPKKFFIDRQRKIDAANNQKLGSQKNSSSAQKKPSTQSTAKSKPNSSLKAYINSSFTESTNLLNHVKTVIGKHVNVFIGDYRFAKGDIIFDLSGRIFTAQLSTPVENNILVKGFLLATPKETTVLSENKFNATFLDLIHKINVEHMKSISDFNLLYKYYEDRPERNEQSQTKYALSAGIYEKEVIFKAISLLENPAGITQKDLIFIFRKVYRVIGTEQRLESAANKLFNSIKKDEFPVDFIMLLAAFFTESGDFKRAIEMANKAKSIDSDAWSKYRYLGLAHLLYSADLSDETAVKQDHDLFKSLTRNEWEFEKYIAEHCRSLAIVGNSPVEISKRKGERIDERAKVIRFNSAITDFPHCLDYGKKTSVLITNPRYYETQRNRKHDLDFILISDGNLFSTRDLFYKVNDLSQFTDKICLLPKKVDLSLTQKICASPSSGLKFLTWLHEINGPISEESLFGFSLTDQAHGVATSYASGRKVGLNTIHNWSSEKIHLEQLVVKSEPEEIA